MTPVASAQRPRLPPAILTFLAPAEHCNQHCPACILDRVGEPVSEFVLTPRDYALFLIQFAEARIPLLAVSFQGYEVTLPKSWPFVEAVFREARRRDIPRDFVTNGMLLHKWIDRIVDLAPRRISISLDGSDAETNDALRGLAGAFRATCSSLERCFQLEPELRSAVAVVSTLFPGRNLTSLTRMPRVLRELGITRWSVGWELEVGASGLVATHAKGRIAAELLVLQQAAADAEIDFHVSDDFGYFNQRDRERLRARRPFDPELLIRLDPLGYVRRGKQIASVWDALCAPRWDPARDDAVTTSGYWSRVEARSAGALSNPERPPDR